jgi:hypothetical protein
MIHDGDPEVARGSFSRDRFDIWVADRTDSTLAAYNSAAARYVEGSDYDEDVAVLDNYGQWDYSPTYQSEVWRPSVSADWSPYSDGYWYSTPIGASWVSNEPWGWFPHHYGNWFFDAGFNSWCWSPAYLFSPAWVYWGFSPSFVGWCPVGYYSRRGSSIAVNGVFDPSRIDLGRGWRFVGTDRFGQRFDRRSLLPGSAVAGRLGSSLAITSRPVVAPVAGRPGSAPAQLQAFARSATQTISRQSTASRSADLLPYLARQRALAPSTVRALTQENSAADRSQRESWRARSVDSRPSNARAFPNSRNVEPRTHAASPSVQNTERRADWRQRPSSSAFESSPRGSETAPNESWRSRYSAPPAQRVIDGIDRGRRFDSVPRGENPQRSDSVPRRFEARPPQRSEPSQRFESAPRRFENPPPQRYEAPRREAPRAQHSAPPPPRMESPRQAPAARSESRSSSRGERRPH